MKLSVRPCQPNLDSIKYTEQRLRPPDPKVLFERGEQFIFLELYTREARRINRFLCAAPEDAAEAALFLDKDALQYVFGEGLPLKYVDRKFPGLTGIVAPHNVFTTRGMTIVDHYQELGVSAEKLAAASALVQIYERYSAVLVNKSSTLQSWLVPLERDRRDALNRQEIAILESLGYRLQENEQTVQYYAAIMEQTFGDYFRRIAMHAITAREFSQYRKAITQALRDLV